jgi:hypothetical protein
MPEVRKRWRTYGGQPPGPSDIPEPVKLGQFIKRANNMPKQNGSDKGLFMPAGCNGIALMQYKYA